LIGGTKLIKKTLEIIFLGQLSILSKNNQKHIENPPVDSRLTIPKPARRFVWPTLQERRTRTKQDYGGISHCIRNDRNFLQ